MKKEKPLKSDKIYADLIEAGKFYFVNTKFDKAIEEFKKALKFNPNDPEIYYNLGLAYESKGELDEARKMYEKAVEINPNYSLAKEHLSKLIGI
ncbi:MAG: tetratricopeptide repeat protein [Elusimicrobiota bacterium]|nr:tetratricopeptide repeat protein [Elusimicrobiota bacterium]